MDTGSRWDTVQLHSGCAECEECINEAVEACTQQSVTAASIYHGGHAAFVKRVAA